MHRRWFLRAMSAPLAAPAVSVLRQLRERLPKLGLQLYSVRDLMERNLGRTLEKVAAIGYGEVEFAGFFGQSPARIRKLLDSYGLQAPSGHVSLTELTQDAERSFDAAAAVGHRYVIVPSLDPEDRRTLDDFRRVAESLNRAGQAARSRGLRVGYHNHDFELAPIAGALPYDLLLSETDPELVCFEMDFFWITRGGADPAAYFERYPGRFHLCHIKDMDRRGEMVDVGAGRIDFRRILHQRKAAGLRHFYVEHDQPRDPLAFARNSYDFLHSLEL
jgi:sugar phosphate isomerase/epimerase